MSKMKLFGEPSWAENLLPGVDDLDDTMRRLQAFQTAGGALNYAAVNPLITAGKEMLETGTFSWLDRVARGQEIGKLIGAA